MEENGGNKDFLGNVLNLNSILTLGRGSKNSPSFRRLHSSRTTLRDSRSGSTRLQWLRSQRVVLCLILISLWAYVGFHVQSSWAHGDHRKTDFVGYKSEVVSVTTLEETAKSLESEAITSMLREATQGEGKMVSDSSDRLIKGSPRKRGARMLRRVRPRVSVEENTDSEFEDVVIPTGNNSFGLMIGPFDETENRIVGLSPQKRKSKCDRQGEFAGLVWTRSFVLVFHELSMTGAPLSMMELATEIMWCGGNVKVVALSKKGGLMWELARRGIEIIEDKGEISFKAAMKADLVIAGSAVCSSWIEQYIRRNPAGSNQLVWWIMENRREYFNRSKHMLSKVNTLTFLSDTQSKQWLSWCEEDKIKMKTKPTMVPLSINDDLAFLAGLPCSLNTPVFTVNKMIEKRNHLRNEVRKKMGLSDNDMLVMSLSSINPAKGQLLLLEAARLVAERNVSQIYQIMLEKEFLIVSRQSRTNITNELQLQAQHLNTSQPDKQTKDVHQGVGETFGRVTIEAMAFGLPVLGTDAGGTREIIKDKVTGLLHPLGHDGTKALAQNIQFFINNPSARKKMGSQGRQVVQEAYLKQHTYGKLAKVIAKCLNVKQ
ncbi:uncharacterized protein LOC110023078 isoform X2 [Phalaenopsis equestris]|uniref:uncharacterized protein LOC110023078 isoform X2 n=1 Tax=Phalaenopsis equestris TaxID=78828 RepID=UPI0009E5C8D5|nr:uncharacterized protein LOC110023078 isoform X2 [Phalaenopsis equestris]